jgi:tetratricopeptide (TPR) repeat protein
MSDPHDYGHLVGRKPTFHREETSRGSYRILLWVALLLAAVWILLQQQRGAVQPMFLPTYTPTRNANSYLVQARTYLDAGLIFATDPQQPDALKAYKLALEADPGNAQVWAEYARVLAYASSLLSTVENRRSRLEEARQAAEKAVELAPDDSIAHAIHAFVLDWYANPSIADENAQAVLGDAEQAAVRALQLDPENALALAFYAEILVDQQKWTQAEVYAKQAAAIEPNSMDVHRVYGYVLESLGYYNAAIQEYLAAAQITPNLTFLYISIGQNYRTLRVYNRALEYFDKAAKINEGLNVKDPLPFIAIAKTYSQLGEFFIAARNAEKALSFDPTDANTYGQLGMIYVKSRNYEGALPVLKCVVNGCTAEENEVGAEIVQSLPLSSLTVAYYYLQYASVLAAFNMCEQAIPVLDQVNQIYPSDPIIRGIIDENRTICQGFNLIPTPAGNP